MLRQNLFNNVKCFSKVKKKYIKIKKTVRGSSPEHFHIKTNILTQVKQTMEEDKVKDKISDEDKQAVVEKAEEVLGWLDTNQQASKEEYEDMKKELEKVAAPVMTKLYQGGQQGWNLT